jgi:hypothetical protein
MKLKNTSGAGVWVFSMLWASYFLNHLGAGV